MSKAKLCTVILSLLVTLAALYFAFRDVQLNLIFAYIFKGKYIYLIPAAVCLWLYCYLRALRWGVFFDKKISGNLLFSATMIGFMANNVFPARLGEVFKAYVIGKHQRISKSSCLATVVLERLWDGLALIFFIAVVFFLLELKNIFFVAVLFIIFYAVVLLALIAWIKYSNAFIRFIGKMTSIFSQKFSSYLAQRLIKFSEGLNIFKDFRRIIIVTFYSVIIWFSAAFTIYFMLRIFYSDIALIVPFFTMVIIGIFAMIPSWGSLGTMQMGFIFALGFYGFSKTEALSFSIVYQFFDTVPVVLAGIYYFWKDGLSFTKVTAIEREQL